MKRLEKAYILRRESPDDECEILGVYKHIGLAYRDRRELYEGAVLETHNVQGSDETT